jgi:hypothetical protein
MAGDHAQAADQGEPAVVMAYLPRDSCHMIDTWHVMGMRGRGSHDVTVTDVFVPTARTFPFVPAFTPGFHYQSPIYRFPFRGIISSAPRPGMRQSGRCTWVFPRTSRRSRFKRLFPLSLRERAG